MWRLSVSLEQISLCKTGNLHDDLLANLLRLDLQPRQLFEASKSWILDSFGLNFDLYSSSAAPSPTPGASISGQMAAGGGICGG